MENASEGPRTNSQGRKLCPLNTQREARRRLEAPTTLLPRSFALAQFSPNFNAKLIPMERSLDGGLPPPTQTTTEVASRANLESHLLNQSSALHPLRLGAVDQAIIHHRGFQIAVPPPHSPPAPNPSPSTSLEYERPHVRRFTQNRSVSARRAAHFIVRQSPMQADEHHRAASSPPLPPPPISSFT